MRRRNVFAMGLALAIGGAGAAFLVDDSVAAPPPLLQLLSPPGAGYDSTNGVLYTGSGGAVTVTRAGTQSCNGGTVDANKPCVENGALAVPSSGQTATVTTPSGLSRTEGCARFCYAPAWTGNNPSAGAIAMLVANDATTARLGYVLSGTAIMRAFDGTSTPGVAATFTAGVRRCFLTQWSATGNYLRITNLNSGAIGSATFSTFPAFSASTYVGSAAASLSPANGALDSIRLGSSPDGCQ